MTERENNSFINAGELSSALNLPKEFLSKILQALTHFKIVASRKGKRGGFRLNVPADQIRLIELLNVFEDKSFFSSCIIGMYKECRGCQCPMHDNWQVLKDEIKNSLLIDIRKSENFLKLNQTIHS